MSGHEQERLSAYLDDELAPGERARIADHLGACAECAARLAELAAVDAAVASPPAEAPQGYFEAFPARVRQRLEPRTTPRRLPVWTWAAAAVLLLAVVTPLTLLRRTESRLDATARAVPAAAPPVLAPTGTPTESRAPDPAPAEPKAELQSRQRASRPAEPARGRRESGFASAPAEADARPAQEPAAPAPSRVTPPAPAAAALEERVADSSEDAALAGAFASGALGHAKAGADRNATDTPRDPLTRKAATDERSLSNDAPVLAAETVAAAPPLAEAEWRRLDATRPRTATDWRLLREQWRAFVARDPDGRQADDARVRMIEAGLEAWRGGRDRADEAMFRRDAAAYLERGDAAQKDYVQRLLTAAGR